MWICPECAAHHDDEARICPLCGTRARSGPADEPVPDYPVPVDPWAIDAATQHVFLPLDAPTSGPPPPATPPGPG